jgi:hypothetical protein
MAIVRPICGSWARYTVPMAPPPMRSRIWYRPIVSGKAKLNQRHHAEFEGNGSTQAIYPYISHTC